MDSTRRLRAKRECWLLVAAFGVMACSKPAAPEVERQKLAPAAIDEAQVRSIVNEIREAHLQLDRARYLAPFADDGSVTVVPLNKKLVVMERETLKQYLDTVWAKTTSPKYSATDEQIGIDGSAATYTATVAESFVINGVRQDQTTEQKWDIELRDGRPKITHINMQVIAR